MANRVTVAPQMFRWAVERSGRPDDALSRFPLGAWEAEDTKPTMRQLEDFARATYPPGGFPLLG